MARNTTVQADTAAPPVTERLAAFVADHPSLGWSPAVEHQARRTFANWVGCAIGPAGHEAVRSALAAVQELSPAPQATLLGRRERVDLANAALVNGLSSHTFDFDDTHLKTIIHPAGPVAPAALALAEHFKRPGRELLDALVIGIEVACRVGNAVYPDHYDRGWHITGSTGMLGSAAACARLLKLDRQQTQMALGIAASQPIGLREQFGTMTKPLHPGAAARAGLMAALFARHGFTASRRALEAPRGLMQVFSDKTDWREITEGLGATWEIALNTYKPFACGIVIHPSIDGCIQLREKVAAAEVERIVLRVHPLVLELTGKRTPQTGLEGKFSVYHSCAVGFLHGRAGEAEYADAVVRSPAVIALRDRIVAEPDGTIDEASCHITLTTRGGASLSLAVEHAIGSLERPMSDEALTRKFIDQATPVLGAAQAEAAAAAAFSIGEAADTRTLLEACVPQR